MVNSECYKKIITMSMSLLFIVFICVAMDENIQYRDIGVIIIVAIFIILALVSGYIMIYRMQYQAIPN